MSIDFSRNASRYDRRHGSEISPGLAHQLIVAAELAPGEALLDLASGTGRVALGLARAGLNVTATDISAEMLAKLRNKAKGLSLATQVVPADRLPFANEDWRAVSLARVLYLVADWRDWLAEIARITVPGGTVLHECGNGELDAPWVRYRDELRARLAARGLHDVFHPGARTEAEVEAELARLGFTRIASVPSGPGTPMTLEGFIEKVETGEISYLWNVPDEVQADVMTGMRDWAEAELAPLDREIELPGGACWRVYRKA